MLVLSRKEGEIILIGDNIKITITRIRGDRVRVGIEAPREVTVLRGELAESEEENAASGIEIHQEQEESSNVHEPA